MTPRRSGSAADSRRLRRSDPRLAAYLVAGFGALLMAIVSGRHEWAALGAPFLVLAAMGLGAPEPGEVRGEVRVHAGSVTEGASVEGEVELDWEGIAEVDVIVMGGRGTTPVHPTPAIGWCLPAGRGPVTLPFQVRARSWGVHDLGDLWARVRRPGGLLIREERIALGPSLRVLPAPLRLDRLLKPAEPRAVSGMHLSRVRGHGTDLAELRPYQPGDRLRDLSWATSARLGTPWVRVHHPERTGTVLLLLDSFFIGEERGTEALARAARAAWAVASVHLQAQDRVGFLARGRTAAWVAPQGGRRARWLLLDELLSVGGAAEDRWRRRDHRTRVIVPSDALIVGVTSLRFPTFIRELLHHRRTGHTTAALVIDTFDLFSSGGDGGVIDQAAGRIWLAEREAKRHRLERSGVPTALVTSTAGVGPAISTLRRKTLALQRIGVGALAR